MKYRFTNFGTYLLSLHEWEKALKLYDSIFLKIRIMTKLAQ